MNDEEISFNFQATTLYKQILDYVSQIYVITRGFPDFELYCLSNQVKRASTSIALNFAEGWGRYNKKEKMQFYKVARASIFECVAIMDISKNQRYIDLSIYKKVMRDSNELSRQLNGLIKSLLGK